jgi:hypothetical protein
MADAEIEDVVSRYAIINKSAQIPVLTRPRIDQKGCSRMNSPADWIVVSQCSSCGQLGHQPDLAQIIYLDQ